MIELTMMAQLSCVCGHERNVMVHEEKLLSELFSYISDRVKHSLWGTGIYTSQDGDENDVKWHNACMELERRGLIYRKVDDGNCVLWTT